MIQTIAQFAPRRPALLYPTSRYRSFRASLDKLHLKLPVRKLHLVGVVWIAGMLGGHYIGDRKFSLHQVGDGVEVGDLNVIVVSGFIHYVIIFCNVAIVPAGAVTASNKTIVHIGC